MKNVGKPPTVLIVDDDPTLGGVLRDFMQQEGYTALVAGSAGQALELQRSTRHLCLAMVDLIMPARGGLELMEQLHERDPELPVVIMTGYATIETAVEAVKRGAADYITKPIDRDSVRAKIGRLVELSELRDRVAHLETGLRTCCPSFDAIVFVSPAMEKVVVRAQAAAAATDASVLLLGETGTGKEMIARAIHSASRRVAGAFIPINCGALPRELVESELFGFRRGAFTGAYADTPGVFRAATGGTVFLDEIGEMPKDAQVKLLRVLQEGELRPVGSAHPVRVDVRIISATNRRLPELRSELLREDLYYRISTVAIEVPPLRARKEDIIVLAQHIARRLSVRYDREITLGRSALDLLVNYAFPGNVRELENLLESATATCNQEVQVITDRDLRPLLPSKAPPTLPLAAPVLTLDQLERAAIEQALHVCQGSRTKAASLLGISRDTLHRKLREYKAST